nr:MAG TPA: hypothetical protein [Bacteriophage sp.]
MAFFVRNIKIALAYGPQEQKQGCINNTQQTTT